MATYAEMRLAELKAEEERKKMAWLASIRQQQPNDNWDHGPWREFQDQRGIQSDLDRRVRQGEFESYPVNYPASADSQPANTGLPRTIARDYDSTAMDVSGDVTDQINESILLQAMSDEKWELEKKRMVDSYNKREVGIALATDSMPNLQGYDQVVSRGSSSKATKSKEKLEKAMIASEWAKNPPRTKGQVIEFISNKNLSPAGILFVKQLAPMYDLGDLKKLTRLDPNDPMGKPQTIYRRKDSDEFFEAIEAGYGTGEGTADRAAAKRAIAIKAIKDLHYSLGTGSPTESQYKEYYNQQTDPIIRAALESWAGQQGFDSGGEVFVGENGEYIWARRGTKEYDRLAASGARRASKEEWATAAQTDRIEALLKKVEDENYSIWKENAGEYGILPPTQVKQWLQIAFKDDLHLVKEAGGWDKLVESFIGTTDSQEANIDSYNILNSALQARLKGGDDVIDNYIQAIYNSNLPSKGDYSQESMIKNWKDILAMEQGWAMVPALMDGPGGVQVPGKMMGRIKRDGSVIYKPGSDFIPDDDSYGIKQGDDVSGTTVVFSPEEARNFNMQERKLVLQTVETIRKSTGLKQMDEGYRDVHQRYNTVVGNLIGMARAEPGDRAWGTFDQQIADVWKKLTDTSMITSEEFRTILEGSSYTQQLVAFLKKRFSEDETGAFLTPEQRRSILDMTRMALVYKQGQAQEFFSTLGSNWEASDIEREAFKKATNPITVSLEEVIPEIDLSETSPYAEALRLSPGADREGSEVIVQEGFNYQTDFDMGSMYPSDWKVRINGIWIPYDEKKHKHLVP